MGWELEASDIEDQKKKKAKEALKRSALQNIADSMGLAKTANDIQANPKRIDAMEIDGPEIDRATGLPVKKKKLPGSY